MVSMAVLFFIICALFSMFTYGFIDPNLQLSKNVLFMELQQPLHGLSYSMRPVAAMVFLVFLTLLGLWYLWFLGHSDKLRVKRILPYILLGLLALVVSFPAVSYDIFNYILTAKVTFLYRENPYVIMPIDIPNESYLAFTRAANKVALYGPVWIAYTVLPYVLGQGNIWMTIIAYKLCNLLWYFLFAYLIFKKTKSMKNVVFFALNPLILIELLVSGHNDLMMMTFALAGFMLWEEKGVWMNVKGLILLVASWLVKGATIVFAPLLLLRNISLEKKLVYVYVLLSAVFFIVAPLREELYPWYAVWLVGTAAFLDFRKHPIIMQFTIVLSFALLLRYIPYMWMGYYEGPGPMLRFLLTIVPIVVYGIVLLVQKFKKRI